MVEEEEEEEEKEEEEEEEEEEGQVVGEQVHGQALGQDQKNGVLGQGQGLGTAPLSGSTYPSSMKGANIATSTLPPSSTAVTSYPATIVNSASASTPSGSVTYPHLNPRLLLLALILCVCSRYGR